MAEAPLRIECYDISNLQGEHPVGSMTVMVDGELAPRLYRSFRVRTTSGPDDYAALREVLTRRFARAQAGEEDWEAPDLLLIDGGKGQLGAALAALADLGVPHGAGEMEAASGWLGRRAAIGGGAALAAEDPPGRYGLPEIPEKPEETKAGTEGEPLVDRVFLPGVKDPVRLRPNTAELFLLARLRDEAHRFAITQHRKLRRKATLRSTLLDVPGVGEKRAKALLRHFGSVREIAAATQEDLAQAPGMSKSVARSLWEHFHSAE